MAKIRFCAYWLILTMIPACMPLGNRWDCLSDEDCLTGYTCGPDGKCTDCLPNCEGRCCGDDGCGGTCADLCGDTGQSCDTDNCQCQGECQPDCAGRECGPDKCLGTCGPGCAEDETCSDGICQQLGCSGDEQCQPGQICLDNTCTNGCRGDRDCPQDQFCLADEPPNGKCVACRDDADCPDGNVCSDGQCRFFCAEDTDCPAEQHCELATGACVECTSNEHCDLGQICLSSCVDGCATDRDCPDGTVCDPEAGEHGQCVACARDEDCLPAETCVEHICTLRCDNDDDCFPLQCDEANGRCVECLSKSDCADLATVCVNFECVYGCDSDRDCPENEFCDPLYGEHGGCGECVTDSQCTGDAACVALRCTTDCSLFDCPVIRPHCHPELEMCVECTEHAHCPDGYGCNQWYGYCVAGDGEGCQSSDECPAEQRCTDDTGISSFCQTGIAACACRVTCADQDPCQDETQLCSFAVSGVCVPSYDVCRDDSHCKSPRPFCDGQSCVECLGDENCPDLETICVADQCVPGCSFDSDCPSDLKCNPLAAEHGACTECARDDHCDIHAPYCHQETGRCVDCLNDAHCGPDQQCHDYFWICQSIDQGVPCESYLQCADTEECADENGVADDYFNNNNCFYHWVPCNCQSR